MPRAKFWVLVTVQSVFPQAVQMRSQNELLLHCCSAPYSLKERKFSQRDVDFWVAPQLGAKCIYFKGKTSSTKDAMGLVFTTELCRFR